MHWFESSRVEFQNLKKDSKNFVSDRNLLWKPELRWRTGKLEMEETEAVVRTFFSVCTKYLISILDFDEGFSSLLILLLRNMFNWEIWVHLHFFCIFHCSIIRCGSGGRKTTPIRASKNNFLVSTRSKCSGVRRTGWSCFFKV